MEQDVLFSVAESLGIVAAAERALRQKTFTEAAEALFLARWRELDWNQLLAWLAHEARDRDERPIGEIIARIVERVPRDLGRFTFFEIPSAIEHVHDADVRDLIIERLRSRIDEDAWRGLTKFAAGDPIFTKVRDSELGCLGRKSAPPGAAFVDDGRAPCSLIAALFEDRRDDRTCIRLLKDHTRDPKMRVYVLWVLSTTDVLPQLGTLDEILGSLPTLGEIDVEQRPATEALLRIARSWEDKGALREWLITRWSSAIERGVPWESLWWEIEPELRDDVALATPKNAPVALVLGALSRRFFGGDLWNRALTFLEAIESSRKLLDGDLFNQGLEHATCVLGGNVTGEKVQEAFQAFDPTSVTAWIVTAPLPAEADTTFDERFLAVARRWSKGLVLGDDILAERLLMFSLTPDRARRILSLTLHSSSSHFWWMDRCMEIADAATKTGVIEDVPVPSLLTEHALAAYRILVGEGANDRLAAYLDERIRAEDIHVALAIAEALPGKVGGTRREQLRALVLGLPISALADIHSSHTWLITEADVIGEAARDDREWGYTERLPEYFRPVITAKAVTTEDERFARALLDRLEALGATRREILDVVLERVRSYGADAIEPSWLSKRLDSRSLWEREPGRLIIAELLGDGASENATTLLQLCFEIARSEKAGALMEVAHTVVAELLVELAHSGIERRDLALAKRALSGIAQLSPRADVRGRIRALREFTTDAEVIGLIEVNEKLLRRPDRFDEPSLDALHDALRELAFRNGGAR